MKKILFFLIIILIFGNFSSSIAETYINTELSTVIDSNYEISFTNLQVEFYEIVAFDPDGVSQGSYYIFNIEIQYDLNLVGGDLFVLFDFLYEEDSGFNINVIDSSSYDEIKNGTSDPQIVEILQAGDRYNYNIIEDENFLIGNYIQTTSSYSERRQLGFEATFSNRLDTLMLGYTIVHDSSSVDITRYNGSLENEYQIDYQRITTTNNNGFVKFPHIAFLLCLPIVLQLKRYSVFN